MKCRYCGSKIPDGVMYCEKCKREVQIVPDYNPLDDFLAENVKQSINGKEKINNETGMTGRNTGKKTINRQNARRREEMEMRRRQAERRRQLKRKKRKKAILISLFMLIAFVGLGAGLYITSYSGVVQRANSALQKQDYTKADELFRLAINKNSKKTPAYIGLSNVYKTQNDLEKAEEVYLDALSKQGNNAELYAACFEFYLNTEQPMKIPEMLGNANENVIDALSDYVVKEPVYSLDAEEKYDDVQQLSLESAEKTIYYTLDGSEPSLQSTKYIDPIQLDEGTTVVKAISVNKKGVPSETISKEYVIEFPIEDAPAVSPSTGQYSSLQSIQVKVPEGYTAYYTTDGTDPAPNSGTSKKYEDTIDMPEGETLFKAVLVNAKGRTSGITTRNYVRE